MNRSIFYNQFYRISIFLFFSYLTVFCQILELTYPSAGVNITCETPFSIQWNGDGASEKVSLYISDNGIDWRSITTTANDGEHTWSIGPLESVNTMRICIMEYDVPDPPLADTSQLFMVTQDKPDPYEPNNDTSQAYEINYGDSLTGGFISYVFKDDRDSDCFWFNGQIGDRVRITFYDGLLNYCLFYLYFGDSLIISGRDKVIDLPKGGKYYILLRCADDYWYENGRYNSLVLQKESHGILILTSPTSGDIFTCETPFSIKWNGDSASEYVTLCISDNSTDWREIGTTLNDGELTCNIGPLDSTISTIQLLIKEELVSNNPLSDTSELFTITHSQLDPYEPNNDTSQAHEIEYGDSLTGGFISYVFKDNRDSDWFWFNGQIGDRVRITFYDGPLNYCLFYLYFGDSLITSGRDKIIYLPKSGKYYLRLRSEDDYWREYGRYCLVLKDSSGVTNTKKHIAQPPKSTCLNYIKPSLKNNYLQVSFNLANQENVLIEIFNVRGQLLQCIDMGVKCAGYYYYNVSINNALNGSYLFRMRVGNKFYKKLLIEVR